ncbi:MAG: MBL fold metallo-hydrolase [Burkholderiales bacterium]
MAKHSVLNVDLADVWEQRGRKKLSYTLAWGDELQVIDVRSDHIEVEITRFVEQQDGSIVPERTTGYIEPPKSAKVKTADLTGPFNKNSVLRINFVDVQQGDGAVIESPDGKVILVDGGDNQLFARYLANRFRGTSDTRPKEIDCILVTHGDADHFAGLAKIHESEALQDKRKRLFIHPKRVYHNGLVKRPGKRGTKSVPDVALLGATRKVGNDTVITGLETDLLKVADAEMNKPFLEWKGALNAYS